jgi:Ca2+-transporting ATPase
MDTFAAMALASLPPSRSVMYDKPRNRRSFIITGKMLASILLTGGFMFAVLFAVLLGLISYHTIAMTGGKGVLFTIFVLFQFWNLFNARAFSTGRSAFRLKGCKWFLSIAAIVFFGQIAIMNLVPDFFNVEPIGIMDWLTIIVGTSVVLIIGEIVRLFSK